MMEIINKKSTIAAQLSTVHSTDEALQTIRVRDFIRRILQEIQIDILIVGWEEKSELFENLTLKNENMPRDIFLWYPFLSDFPEFNAQHLMININNIKSKGWDGYSGTEIKESFMQACPNNPFAVSTSLKHLERLLMKYDFDGVFIDKIRFPSMASGLQDVLSCFCPYCMAKANEVGVDINRVKDILKCKGKEGGKRFLSPLLPETNWLEQLIDGYPILQEFINFRTMSVNQVVAEINDLVKKLNKKMSLDVFSPSLAPLVGQDFGYMATLAEWVKPMIYRFGNGPSSLRSEIPAIIYELSRYLDISINEVSTLITSKIDGLQGIPLQEIEKVAPLSLIQSETQLAIKQLSGTPVYLGLETVSIPGKMDITPKHVQEIVEIGKAANVQGFVLSWDLLHTPLENILPLKMLR
jgi:hypothetical protein